MKKLFALSVMAAALTAGVAQAAPFAATSQEIQREASEGPRGGDRERPGDRQRRGGRVIEDDGSVHAIDGLQLARERASGGGRQRQRHGAGAGLIEDDMPNAVDALILAREASEGPRGGDNERPGDRQRRGRRG